MSRQSTLRSLRTAIGEVSKEIADLETWQDRLSKAAAICLRGSAMNRADRERGTALVKRIRDGIRHDEAIVGLPSEAAALLDGWGGLGLATIEQNLSIERERLKALTESLPSDTEIAQAQTEAARMAKKTREAGVKVLAEYETLRRAIDQAELAAERVAAAHSQAAPLAIELAEHAKQWDLSIEIPQTEPTPEDRFVPAHAALLIENAARHLVVDPMLSGELNRRREAAA